MRSEYKVLFIDAGTLKNWIRVFNPEDGYLGPIDVGIILHLNEYRSYESSVFSERNVLVVGKGFFTGGRLFGTHRLIFVFRSPISQGLHVSALGGAGYKFMNSGLDAIVIEGRSKSQSILFIYADRDCEVSVDGFEIDLESLWSIYNGYEGYKGVYAFTKYLVDTYRVFLEKYNSRPLLVGPAALTSILGGIFSVDINPRKGSFLPGSEDSASRGGGGSVLYKSHNVVAVIVGGLCKRMSYVNDSTRLNSIAKEVFKKTYPEAVLEYTEKYRYTPRLGTGGTFGVNYIHYRDLIPIFGYNMVYMSKATRLRHNKMILEYFWKPFNEEVFHRSRSWYTCGEPCPVLCKKVWGGKKVDYEPFNALGPYIGVYHLKDSAELVELVDSLGFDAIEIGHIIGWIFDSIHNKILKPEEVGLNEAPYFDALAYSHTYSDVNARLASELIQGLVRESNDILRSISEKGLRTTAKKLDELYSERVKLRGLKFEDFAVYAAFGDEGYMTINFYWTPGMISPLFMLGRYWTNYSSTFMEPEEYAESSIRRALLEYLIDNAGICRFHRRWAEKILDKLYRDFIGVDIDILEHARKMYRMIIEYDLKANASPRYWESRKTKDILYTIASEIEIRNWVDKFNADYESSMREWWDRFYNKVLEEFKIVEDL